MTQQTVESRTDLKNYALRKLGHPVIKINVSDDQIDDRIDDALQMYANFHTDATVNHFLVHVITAQDVSRKWLEIPSDVLTIKRIVPLADESGSSNGSNITDALFQMRTSDVINVSSSEGADLIYFNLMNTQIRQTQFDIMGTSEMIHFTRNLGRLYIHINWGLDIKEGDAIVLDTTRIIPEDASGLLLNDLWIKKFATSSIKYQWGSNLSKYEGIAMVGGVTFNGPRIMDEAKEELMKYEEELRTTWELPPVFMMG